MNAATAASGLPCLSLMPMMGTFADNVSNESIHIIGPKEGYSNHIGTILSMMTWTRWTLLLEIGLLNLKIEELDYLPDKTSSSIGAILLHLAAKERKYQIDTFEWNTDFKGNGMINWTAAMNLGEEGRRIIKGNEIDYYYDILDGTRCDTINEFKKRQDEWLFIVHPSKFSKKPTNNYCIWFELCQNEYRFISEIKKITKQYLISQSEKR